MPPSLLPRGLRWKPEHPLEAPGIREPTGNAVAGELDAERGGVGQAGPWRGSVGRPARPQVLSRLTREDAASCSDSSSLLGLELVGNWVSEAVSGRGSGPAPPTADEAPVQVLGSGRAPGRAEWRRRRRRPHCVE